MDTPRSKLTRRKFLLAAGASGAAATAALVAGNPGAPSKPENQAREGQGYHVTEHILKYYRTAKV
jgi:hypothetical protein